MKNKKCQYCAEEIKEEAIKCKHCGTVLIDEKEISSKEGNEEPKSLHHVSFIKGVGCSFAFGIGAFVLGGILTITVIGSIIGIPMLFIGVGAICLSPVMFLMLSEGSCPYCNNHVVIMDGKKVAKCKECKNRFSICEKMLHRIPK